MKNSPTARSRRSPFTDAGAEPPPRSGLRLRAGQCTRAGHRPDNEDCCGILIPEDASLHNKGIVAVVADGVGSSEAGREASEYCVRGFIGDYYSTPDSWTVQTSGERVIAALNSWLYNQGHKRFASEHPLASTLTALVVKSITAHVFHIGDSRAQRLRDGVLEPLTRDHRIQIGAGKDHLARAMGAESDVRIDYSSHPLAIGDVFVLTSDGVHGFLPPDRIAALLEDEDDPERAAEAIVAAALEAGSDDNLSCQVLRIESLPNADENDYYQYLTRLPFPPPLGPGMTIDGYEILDELHTSSTIQVYLARPPDGGPPIVLKTPSVNYEDDPAYIDRFVHEEWVGRRIDDPHVLRVLPITGERSYLYYVTEYIEGQSLSRWMETHPKPTLDEVRAITEQITKGLRAFHRREMVHQDIKPDNLMIDRQGRIKIIDFGSTYVAGLEEIYRPVPTDAIQGTANFIAPELFSGHEPSPVSDLFSLGVTVYVMLSGGRFPYPELDRARALKAYHYTPIRDHDPAIPVWIDGALRKATHPLPEKRYSLLSEFLYDLEHPNAEFLRRHEPLIEKNPAAFWRLMAGILLLTNLLTLFLLR